MGIISRKERTEKLEAKTIEVTNLSNRKNIDFNRKKNETLRVCGTITKFQPFMLPGSQRGERRRGRKSTHRSRN